MINFLKDLFTDKNQVDLPALLAQGAMVLDVRTPQEFRGGHVKGSINIPLAEISNNLNLLKQVKKPIITCCRSGMRSANAANILRNVGLEAYNGQTWKRVQTMIEEL